MTLPGDWLRRLEALYPGSGEKLAHGMANGTITVRSETLEEEADAEAVQGVLLAALGRGGSSGSEGADMTTGPVKQFIIWDEADGKPRRNEDGEWISDGLVGRIGLDNVYLTAYGVRPEGSYPYDELEVNQALHDVVFSLSGSKGRYSVYRVR